MTDDRLAVSDLRKTYAPVEALRGVSLSFDTGGVHCLAGPNGSGKSTLFRVLLGLAPATSGTVTRPAGNVVGAGFQEPAFYDSLTVAENIDVFGALSGASDEEWIETVLEVFALDSVRHRRAGDLSGGFAKQLDLTLAVLKRPRYLLLDEPLADLDHVSTEALLEFLSAYAASGNAVVVSSHRIEEFAPAVDRLTVLYDGKIARDVRRDEETEPIPQIYRDAIDAAMD